ncbi:helix-turn-helix domain-containing protein [Snuella sedimenti]|uniref:AraC family transcriptional regulator n=1 Tax=Snuella sedimenti TaxID=2798802 RepID=A0A8J7LMJ6_9FLAO|nr:helix-turn-helix domain-containing protein [Snuella sedimenti]MBJ6367629.1 AraC family transcriptional regulator [Snuella sedimenti]
MPKLIVSNLIKDHPLFLSIVKVNYKLDDTSTIASTGYNYLVFILSGNFKIKDEKGERYLSKYFLNSSSNYYELSARKGDTFLAIRLSPDKFHRITGNDLSKSDPRYNLEHIIPEETCTQLQSELQNCNDVDDHIKILDKYLSTYYSEWLKPTAISTILEHILKNNGMLSVTDIIENFHISHSTLNRHFKKVTGVTTNKFLRLIRVNYIIRQIEQNKTTDLLPIIENYKYYDYSHFSKNIKEFTGQTPKQFFRNKHSNLREILYKKINF